VARARPVARRLVGQLAPRELNVEKLWSPHIAPHGVRHGKMGIIELRSVRMPERPIMLAAVAVLFRSIVARLVVSHYRSPLIDWHDELHDRFALPSVLARDLRLVLGDLDEHGLGVPALLRRELEVWRPAGILCRLGDATLTLRPALEFWPLVGGRRVAGARGRADRRRVDAALGAVTRWRRSGSDRGRGRWAHPRAVGDGVRAIGVRRRVFQPAPGLHPGLPATDPLVVEWAWAGRAQRIELWRGDRRMAPTPGCQATTSKPSGGARSGSGSPPSRRRLRARALDRDPTVHDRSAGQRRLAVVSSSLLLGLG